MATKAGLDYADAARQAQSIEAELDVLLEEMARTLSRSAPADEVSRQACALAESSAALAAALERMPPERLGEEAARIDRLSLQTDALLRRLPDAIVASEHDHWAAQLETIRASVREMRASLNELSLPHLHARRRGEHERHVSRHLSDSKRLLHAVRQAVRHRSHVPAHPLHKHLSRMREAMSATREHVHGRWQEHLAAQRVQTYQAAYLEMREFFSRQMAGRLYADAHSLQLRSDLTGRVAEWTLDEPHAWALAQFLGPSAESLAARLAMPGRSLAARFEITQLGGHVQLVLDGGERVIEGNQVHFEPLRLVRAL